jgi:hypothetical protein
VTWPPVFAGRGALVVNCALDPDSLLDAWPRLTWIAVKVGGTDVSSPEETLHCTQAWTARGIEVGAWTYCTGPPKADVDRMDAPWKYIVYDVEAEYKDQAGWTARLVAEHNRLLKVPAAVTSYGAITGYGNFPSSIDFGPFAAAGWPLLAQVYDPFQPGDELTYRTDSPRTYPGPYPEKGVHRLYHERRLLLPGESVYRPESLG